MSWESPRNGRASLGGRVQSAGKAGKAAKPGRVRPACAAPARLSLAALSGALLLAAVLCGCEPLSGRTGGGTETEAFGMLRNTDGAPAARTRVLFRPADYLADSLLTSEEPRTFLEEVTDDRGRFRILGLAPGAYRMEAEGGNGRGVIRDFVLERQGQRLELPADTLRPFGSISGSFAPDSTRRLPRYVQIYGMERLVLADPANGSFMIPNLPPGDYDLRCQGLDPFRKQAVLRDIRVRSGEITRVDTVVLEEMAKLTYRIEDGALSIDGVGPGNPVVFDNEFWDNGVENEYLWIKASLGRLDLRGNVVTNGYRDSSTVDAQLAEARNELLAARQSGLSRIPDPVAGSRLPLLPSPSGLIDDIAAETSEGSDLIVAAARQATPERPLLVLAGGALTTVANAYLSDPAIAPRMVVMAVYPFSINAYDSLAAYVVAKRCRMVAWGRGYLWGGSMDPGRVLALPGNRMAERVRAFLLPQARAGRNLLGDIAPVAALFRPGAWTDAELAKVSLPLTVTRASSLAFDFLDIPASANDWPRFQDEFFGALGDTAAQPAAAVPGRLEAESYAARSGARGALTAPGSAPDTSLGDAMAGTQGAWLEFKVMAAAGTSGITVRYRSAEGGRLRIGIAGGDSVADAVLPPTAVWREVSEAVAIGAGEKTLRVTWIEGSSDLDWFQVQ